MVLVHELGHVIAIRCTWSVSSRIAIWPGYEIYPAFGTRYTAAWPGESIAIVQPLAPIPRSGSPEFKKQDSIITLMGSASTLFLSLLSLIFLSIFKPGKVLLPVLVSGSLMHVDMLAFVIFPEFLGLPHFVFLGGTTSEPIVSLGAMGFPKALAVGTIIALSLAQFYWLYCLLKAREKGIAS